MQIAIFYIDINIFAFSIFIPSKNLLFLIKETPEPVTAGTEAPLSGIN